MKTKFLQLFNKQLVFLLSVLGFSLASTQCAAQYGAIPTPYYSTYKGRGVIKTEENVPIKNIRVVVEDDTLFTDSNGVFSFTLKKEGWVEDPGYKAELLIVDIDGKENGVYYCQVKTVFLKPREQQDIEITLKSK